MKVKGIEALKCGMWCRLASGEVYTCSNYRDDYVIGLRHGLIMMGAEWFPKIPDGYRLATEGDRKGLKPGGVMMAGKDNAQWLANWVITNWHRDMEYIVPDKKTCATCGREL